MTEQEAIATILVNQRVMRNGSPPISNALEALPEKLRDEVMADAQAVIEGLQAIRVGPEPVEPAAGCAIVHTQIRYVCETAQETLNSGVNVWALDLIAESLGDQDKLVEGGVMFAFPFDHKKRPVWVIVTGQAPFVASVASIV